MAPPLFSAKLLVKVLLFMSNQQPLLFDLEQSRLVLPPSVYAVFSSRNEF